METLTKKLARMICCVTKKNVKRGLNCVRPKRRKIQQLNQQNKVVKEIIIPTKMYSTIYVNELCRSESSSTVCTLLEPETLDNLVNHKLEMVLRRNRANSCVQCSCT